jgi:hypothetical protein
MTEPPKLNLVPVTDPSVPAAAPPPAEPASTSDSRKARNARRETPGAGTQDTQGQAAAPPAASPWRDWSSFDRTVSYRLPPELVTELEDRLWDLRLPVGVTVAAAIADLLDKPNEALVRLVERAEEAKPRRRSRTTG